MAEGSQAGYCTRVVQYARTQAKVLWITPAKHGPPTCANCSVKAAVYCVNCNKSFCRFCAVLLHHPSTKPEKHSLEDIDLHQIPVKILSPILLDLLIIVAAGVMLSGPSISSDYFSGQSYCPALNRGRKWLAWFDANVFFYYKANLSKYCDWEDSYWRFFVDTWVRGVLTNADGWLIIASQLAFAVVFEEFLRILVTPIVAVGYACIATVVRLIEWEMSFLLPEQQKEFVNGIGKVLSKFSFAAGLAIKDKKAPPPPTFRRKRPMEDWNEGARYWYNRYTRLISYYKVQAQTACRFFFRGSIKVAVFVRVATLLMGNSALKTGVRLVGLEEVADKHVAWFADSHGMDVKSLQDGARVSDTGYSDWIAGLALGAAGQNVPLLGRVGRDMSAAAAGGLFSAMPYLRRSLLLMVLLCVPPALLWYKLWAQRKNFTAQWKKKTCAEIFGSMSRDSPCKEWSEVRFSPPEAAKAAAH